LNRRSFLKGVSGAGMMSVLPGTAFALHTVETDHIIHEVAGSGQDPNAQPKDSIRFSVCGVSHDHIWHGWGDPAWWRCTGRGIRG
jgi:hypothetical protein